MANRVFRILASEISTVGGYSLQVRHGHHLRGKPPTIALSLKERLELLNAKDPATSFIVDIGLPAPKPSRQEIIDFAKGGINTQSPKELEVLSRNRKLLVDLDHVRKVWLKTNAPQHISTIANHYGVFKDLFGDAQFAPVVPLDVKYTLGENNYAKVYTGNVIKPSEAAQSPSIKYDSDPNTLWTLSLTTPDGNLQNATNEYCHWFIANIPGNSVEQGEQLIDYLMPIPPRGVGYFRYIFVLYKQEKKLDFSEYKRSQPCTSLKERDWNTLDFYRKYQDDITPAGLAFFQSDWDSSIKQVYHTLLGTREPIFQYDFPKPYIKPQVWFPLKQPFNVYLDKYRDPKEIKKEFLLRKLKNVHPFKGPKPPLKYPYAHPIKEYIPSWLKVEKKKSKLGWGRINEVE